MPKEKILKEKIYERIKSNNEIITDNQRQITHIEHKAKSNMDILRYVKDVFTLESEINCKKDENKFLKELLNDVNITSLNSKWVISSDGYYPYCPKCHYRPNGELKRFCANCGMDMLGE